MKLAAQQYCSAGKSYFTTLHNRWYHSASFEIWQWRLLANIDISQTFMEISFQADKYVMLMAFMILNDRLLSEDTMTKIRNYVNSSNRFEHWGSGLWKCVWILCCYCRVRVMDNAPCQIYARPITNLKLVRIHRMFFHKEGGRRTITFQELLFHINYTMFCDTKAR